MERLVSRLPHNTTKIFTDIWEEAVDFVHDYEESGIYASVANRLDNEHATLLYYLLYSKYGNSAIANLDETQFKYKVFTTIFQYGPTWKKKLDIQNKLRSISDADLVKGSKAINAHAMAMGDDNIIATDDPTKIDQKSSTYFERSKMEAYSQLLDLLETDVTGEFLNKFKPLFATFVYTKPDIYVTESDEEEEE